MPLLELPLEILQAIISQAIIDISWEEFIQLQLVNKVFARQAKVALCCSRARWQFHTWQPLVNDYICARALAANVNEYYAFRTIQSCRDWIAVRQPNGPDLQNICYALSRSAASFYSQPLTDACYGPKTALQEAHARRGGDQTSDSTEHRLSAAACIGNLSLIQTLIDEGADVNAPSDIFGTPLLNAAREGHLPVIRLLLKKGADINRDSIDWTEGEDRNEQFVRKFLIEDIKWTHFSPLGAAAYAGHEETVAFILSPEINLSRSSCSFFHAIIYAAWSGNIPILQTIFSAADFAALPRNLNIKKRVLSTALKGAASGGHLPAMRFLIDNGAPVGLIADRTLEDSPLSYAAAKGQDAAIELLLSRGADINETMSPTPSPLACAVEGMFPRTVALLVDRGAEGRASQCNALVHCEAYCVLRVLLEKGVHQSYPFAAKLALLQAREKERWDFVELLEGYGIVPEGMDELPGWL
ncbi:ankyrin repeat domain-containing protein [Aspergillus mulundensis]|uniref:Uncharacterized protein n=1 Tax=Aspergillus mulundensis TaxID=1810919 RepID=A0A3D8S6C0_9EURO|nr:hypothetical protein DSM5745_05168 [Aspergillus mulundensis]RDW81611.1 hypothetical protein DSM5745_05168 [Aspergillus mulundensis]